MDWMREEESMSMLGYSNLRVGHSFLRRVECLLVRTLLAVLVGWSILLWDLFRVSMLVRLMVDLGALMVVSGVVGVPGKISDGRRLISIRVRFHV